MKKSHIRTIELGKTLDRGRSIEEQFLIQEATSATFEGAESALKELIDIKLQFEAALKTSDYQAFAYCNFRFPGTPDLVSAGGFNPSHDLSGNFLQDLGELTTYSQNVFLSVLPSVDGFWASFLWPRGYLLIERFVEDIEQNYSTIGGVYSVALAHIENSFLRPSFWEGLNGKQKERLQFLAMMDVMHRDYVRTKREVNELNALYPTPPDLVLRG